MATNSTNAKKREKVLKFSSEFGDLSPIEEFKGPKTPSNRQVLRLLLYWVSIGYSLQSAAAAVVTEVLRKQATAVSKTPRQQQQQPQQQQQQQQQQQLLCIQIFTFFS